jgi:hypothetical protein
MYLILVHHLDSSCLASSTIFFGDDTTDVRATAGKSTARTANSASVSHIFGGGEQVDDVKLTTRIREPGGTGGKSSVFAGNNDDDDVKITTRIREPGGTGGRSTLFDPDPVKPTRERPVQPNPLYEAAEEPVRLSTKPLQPGGTGGKSRVFDDDEVLPSPPVSSNANSAGDARNAASPFATDNNTPYNPEPVRTSAKILQPGGMGGQSHVFDSTIEVLQQAVSNLDVASPTSDGGSGDEKKPSTKRSVQNSQVFAASEDEESQTWSGRKVEAGRTNMSQVALGGGYPDAEPTNRDARRGNIRTTYNQSQIMFGDDTGGAPVKEKAAKLSSRVLRPGGTGGGSQIAFGDDTGGEPVTERKAGTSTKVLRPGGLGGTSQITFGDDTSGAPADKSTVTSSKVNRPGGFGGSSQINFAHDAPAPSGPTKTSSRVLRPGGTGGTSQITF